MYHKILVPLDGSELAECVLPHVAAVAKGCGAGEVVFLRVVEPFTMQIGTFEGAIGAVDVEHINAQHQAEAEKYLSDLVAGTKYDGVAIRSEVIIGRAAEVITEYARKNGVDLIIIATHGRSGVSRWVWGSVTDRVLRSTQVSVLVVRPKGGGSAK